MAKNKFESSTNSAEQTPAPANVEKANQTDQAEKKRSIGQRAIDNLRDFAHGESGKEAEAVKPADADDTIAEPVAPSEAEATKTEAPKVEAGSDQLASAPKHFANGESKSVRFDHDAARNIDLEDFAVAYMANKNLTTADYLEQVKANEANAQAQKSLDSNLTSNNDANTSDNADADAELTTVITGNKAQAPIPVDPLKNETSDKGGEKKEGFFKRHWKKMMVGAVAVSLAIASYFGVKNYAANLPKAEPIEQSDKDVNNNANNDDKQSEEDKQRAAAAEQSNNEAKEWQAKADKMGLTVDEAKDLADKHGIALGELGTPAAQAKLRDQMTGTYNVNEPFTADGDANMAMKEMKFFVYNSDLELAQVMSAINSPDKGGLDGLENGTTDINSYIDAYQQDGAKRDADRATVLDFLNNSTVTARQATDKVTCSTANFDQQAEDLTVVSHAENLGGNQWIYYFAGNAGTAYENVDYEIKDECGQLNVPFTIVINHGGNSYHGYVPPTTTNNPPETTNPPVNPPVNPPINPPTVTPPAAKDPSQDVNVNPENPNQTDKAPATDKPQEQGPAVEPDASDKPTSDGSGVGTPNNQVNNGNHYVKPDGDAGEVGNTGSTTVPKPDDENGNISGVQPEEPGINQW